MNQSIEQTMRTLKIGGLAKDRHFSVDKDSGTPCY